MPSIADRTVREKVTKGRVGIMWDSVVKKAWKDTRGNQEGMLSTEKFEGYKTEVKERIEIRERLALRNKVKKEEHFRDLRGVKGRDRDENVYARSHELRENAETAISCRGPDWTCQKKKEVYQGTSSRGEEKEDAQMCPCGKEVLESIPHIVGECEIYKEERYAVNMRKIDECGTEKFGTLDNSSEKTIAISGERWWLQMAKQEGDKISKPFLCNIWGKRHERPNVGGISIRSRNGAPSRKGCVVNGQMTKASNK